MIAFFKGFAIAFMLSFAALMLLIGLIVAVQRLNEPAPVPTTGVRPVVIQPGPTNITVPDVGSWGGGVLA